MQRCRPGPSLLAVLLTVAGGCGAVGSDADADPTVRIDTIGGVVHVISGERGVWDEAGGTWRVDAGEALAIGEADGPEAYVFGRVSGVYVADDGRIYVADSQALETRVFSPAGEFVGRFGRGGEGPGEFGHIGGIGRAPDGGIALLDGELGRVSVFDPDGMFRRAFRLERPFMILTMGESVRFDGAGRYYDVTRLSRVIGTDSLGVIRYSAEGTVEDTTLIAVQEPRNVLFERDGLLVMSMRLPYAPQASGAVGPDGTAYATLGAEYRITRFAADGDTALVIRRNIPPVRLSDAERDSARADLVERHREVVDAEPRNVPEIPEHAPAVLALRVDDLGFLWALRAAAGDSLRWDVFDRAGPYLGTVTLPAMNIMHIGERFVAGVVYDDLDIPSVVVLPLARQPSD